MVIMRMMQWFGGISLVGLSLFGGCSCGEEMPFSLPDLIGKGGAGGKTANDDSDGTGGIKQGAGGTKGGNVGSGGKSQNTGGRGGDDEGATEHAGSAGEAGFAGQDGPADAGAGGQFDSGPMARDDAGPAPSQQDAQAVFDAGRVPEATIDAIATTHPDAKADDPPDPSCKLTSGDPCELSVQFVSQSGDIAGLTLVTCPDGADPSTGLCMGYGNLGNSQWTVSSDGTSLDGMVGVRAPDIPATVQKEVLGFPITMTCHLSIGGDEYVQVPIRIALPQGTSAKGFVPGCTAVSDPQVTLRGPIEYSVSGDSGCASAAALAEQSGGLGTLEQGVRNLIASAITQQICRR